MIFNVASRWENHTKQLYGFLHNVVFGTQQVLSDQLSGERKIRIVSNHLINSRLWSLDSIGQTFLIAALIVVVLVDRNVRIVKSNQ